MSIMKTHTVLIVDDEGAIRDMLRMALEVANFRCLEAEDIRQAHRLIVDERPDIVLLDWMLPGGTGLELLHRLKRDELTREVPVIMLTAKTAEDKIKKQKKMKILSLNLLSIFIIYILSIVRLYLKQDYYNS